MCTILNENILCLFEIFKNIGIIVGIIIGLYQFTALVRTRKLEHCKIIISFFDYWHLDKQVNNLFYELEHNTFNFDLENDLGQDKEKNLDKLLEIVIKIGIIYEHKFINKADLKCFTYEINTIYNNKSIKKYLNYLSSDEYNNENKKSKLKQ